MTLFFRNGTDEGQIREAAWIARCVGHTETSPLSEADLSALAGYLESREFERGNLVFSAGSPSSGVWIVRSGLVELVVGSGPRRLVIQLLRPGDVDGDMHLVLDMPPPYSARAVLPTRFLYLAAGSFERLLTDRPAIARRWLSSVASRVSGSQRRVLELLGRSLREQAARLLLDEEVDRRVALPQRTLAAMLGVQRPSLNKVLKDMERRDWIQLRYGEVVVKDAEALEAAASGRS